jgi:hypothetical protein
VLDQRCGLLVAALAKGHGRPGIEQNAVPSSWAASRASRCRSRTWRSPAGLRSIFVRLCVSEKRFVTSGHEGAEV